MVLRYINMPRLVAIYLREFSKRKDGNVSNLYWFIFCLCLPFISTTFNRARLIALAIAECTDSADQIKRLLEKITGATVNIVDLYADWYAPFNGEDDTPDFPYFPNSTNEDVLGVTFDEGVNAVRLNITLNGASKTEIEAYLRLLVPFYIRIQITYNE